jgi:hypothetical protein
LYALRRRRLGDTHAPHGKVSQGSQDGLAFLQPGGRRRGRPALCSPLDRNACGTFSTQLVRESVLRLCAGRRLWEHAVARQRGVQRRAQQLHSERIPDQAEAGSRLRLRSEQLQPPARDHQSVLPDDPGDPGCTGRVTPSTKMTAAELSGRSISQSVT